jgi:hypothetical protein
VALAPLTRGRIFLRDSANHEGRPAHALIVEAFTVRLAAAVLLTNEGGIFSPFPSLAAARRICTRTPTGANSALLHPQRVLCRWRLTVDLTALVGAPIDFHRHLPGFR